LKLAALATFYKPDRAQGAANVAHIALIGDSVFDNGAYIGGQPDVNGHLQRYVPSGWQSTLVAVDGSTTADIGRQLKKIPDGTTHLVISAGGNDALGYSGVLANTVTNIATSLDALSSIQDEFRTRYRSMLEQCLPLGKPIAVCTIYDPRYPDPAYRRITTTALSLFNDAIIREATKLRIPILDLRAICNADDDFANPIEPSSQGGEKIAKSVLRLVQSYDFTQNASSVFVD
jgi:hypothetical protein